MENNISKFIDNEVKTTVINVGTEEDPCEIEVKTNYPRSFLNAVIDVVLDYFSDYLKENTFASYDFLTTITAAIIFDQFTNANIKSTDEVGYILDHTDIFKKVVKEIGEKQYEYIIEGVMEGRKHIMRTREFGINLEQLLNPIVNKIEDLREWVKDVDLKEIAKAFEGLDTPDAIKDIVAKHILNNEEK